MNLNFTADVKEVVLLLLLSTINALLLILNLLPTWLSILVYIILIASFISRPTDRLFRDIICHHLGFTAVFCVCMFLVHHGLENLSNPDKGNPYFLFFIVLAKFLAFYALATLNQPWLRFTTTVYRYIATALTGLTLVFSYSWLLNGYKIMDQLCSKDSSCVMDTTTIHYEPLIVFLGVTATLSLTFSKYLDEYYENMG